MADVTVPFGDNPSDTATLLLAAAEEAGEDPSVVRTGEGVFVVDKALAEKADVVYVKEDGEDEGAADEAKEAPPAKTGKRSRSR